VDFDDFRFAGFGGFRDPFEVFRDFFGGRDPFAEFFTPDRGGMMYFLFYCWGCGNENENDEVCYCKDSNINYSYAARL